MVAILCKIAPDRTCLLSALHHEIGYFFQTKIGPMTTPLQDFKIHMNATDDEDDAILAQKLAVATAWVAKQIGEPVTEASDATIHEATRMLAAHLFESREATIVGMTAQEVPFGVWDMLAGHRQFY